MKTHFWECVFKKCVIRKCNIRKCVIRKCVICKEADWEKVALPKTRHRLFSIKTRAAKESAGYRNLLLSAKKEECMTLKFLSSGLSLTPASTLTEKAFSSGLEATTDVRVTKKFSYYYFFFGDVTNK